MEKRPRALLLKFPGTNCDAETARALEAAGFATSIVAVSRLAPGLLESARVVVFSGGFSYGDYVMSGRFASLITRRKLGDSLAQFRDRGGFLLGICNGFQILTQLGLLPEASLVENGNGKFLCRWVTLRNLAPSSPFLRYLPEEFELPVAHAEGRFVTRLPADADRYRENGVATLVYRDEINGSFARIAGTQDDTGRVFGLMPHPERFLYREDHYDPDWKSDSAWGSGFHLFRSLRDAVGEGKLESVG